MQWMYNEAKTVPARMSVKDFTVTLWMSLQFIGCNLATWKFWLQEAYIAHILQWRKCGCSISLVQHINSSCNYFMRNILRYHLQWCITTMKWKVILIYDKDLLDVVYILKRIQLNSSYIFVVFYLFLFHLLIHWFFFFFVHWIFLSIHLIKDREEEVRSWGRYLFQWKSKKDKQIT